MSYPKTNCLAKLVVAVALTAAAIAGSVFSAPPSSAAPETTVLSVVARTHDRDALGLLASSLDAVVVAPVNEQRNIWLIEAERPLSDVSPEAVEAATAQLARSFSDNLFAVWAVSASAEVAAHPFFVWGVDGYPFFAWSDQPDTAVDRYPFVAWADPGQSVDAYPFFAWSNRDDGASERGFDLIQYAQLDGVHQQVTGSGVVVAVLDTGFDASHPLLASRMMPGIDIVDGDSDTSDHRDGIDNDQDGITDEAYGHGTYVAGVIAQVAPSATILPIRVLTAEGTGELHAVIDGIDEAVERGASVINLSFGTDTDDPALADAIQRAESAGAVVVAASGNDAGVSPRYPAAYTSVVSVAPYDPILGEVASFGNLSDWVDVSALGVYTMSSTPGGNYGALSGSSVASPVVAGQAALLLQAQPGRTPAQVRFQIHDTASSRGSQIRFTRHGLIDIPASLQLESDAQTTPGSPPVGSDCSVDHGAITITTPAGVSWVRRNQQNVGVATTVQPDGVLNFVDPDYDPAAIYSVAGWHDGHRTSYRCTNVLPPAAPSIDLVKRVEGFDANTAPGPEFHVGDVVEITYDVTNDGNVDLVDVVVDDATLGIITCPQDTLAVGETFQCVITETLIEEFTFFSPIFMEAEARGSFQSEVVRDDDPINFTVVKPLAIVQCGFAPRSGVLSVVTDQNSVFLNAQFLVHQGGESSPSVILNAEDAQTRLDFRGEFFEFAYFGLSGFISIDVTVTPVYSVPGSSELKTGAKVVCRRSSSPIALDLDQSGAVERIDATVEFDFDGDGTVEQATEWFAPSEGILFDATIDGPLTGEHLFGDQGGSFADGFAKLATRDLNTDGVVSGAELDGLALWTDTNTNGVLDSGEIVNLAATGVVSLSTTHINYVSTATMADGTTMVSEDLWFQVTAAPATQSASAGLFRNLAVTAVIALAAAAAVVTGRRKRHSNQLDTEIAELLGTTNTTNA